MSHYFRNRILAQKSTVRNILEIFLGFLCSLGSLLWWNISDRGGYAGMVPVGEQDTKASYHYPSPGDE